MRTDGNDGPLALVSIYVSGFVFSEWVENIFMPLYVKTI